VTVNKDRYALFCRKAEVMAALRTNAKRAPKIFGVQDRLTFWTFSPNVIGHLMRLD
jgi:hypothetical protein